jgi:hypothetical protein
MLLSLATTGSLLAMSETELNLNGNDLEARFSSDVGAFIEAIKTETVFLGFRYLRSSHYDSSVNRDQDLFDAHFYLRYRFSNLPALTLGIGTKFVVTKVSDKVFSALPLGAVASYDIPAGNGLLFILGLDCYYSYMPKILSINDEKQYLEARASLEIRLVDRVGVVFGYRDIQTDFHESSFVFDNMWYLGVRFRF